MGATKAKEKGVAGSSVWMCVGKFHTNKNKNKKERKVKRGSHVTVFHVRNSSVEHEVLLLILLKKLHSCVL